MPARNSCGINAEPEPVRAAYFRRRRHSAHLVSEVGASPGCDGKQPYAIQKNELKDYPGPKFIQKAETRLRGLHSEYPPFYFVGGRRAELCEADAMQDVVKHVSRPDARSPGQLPG
jgi:hypothetical protein